MHSGSEDSLRIFDLNYQPPPGKKQRPIFQILAGHSSAAVSDALISESAEFMVTVSGDRGLLGETDKLCLFYEIKKSPGV